MVPVSAHSMLQGFTSPSQWSGLVSLTPVQVAALRPEPPAPSDGPTDPSQADHALMEVLSRDGRTGYGELADATGWSESTVRRRMDHLRRTAILRYEVDLPLLVGGARPRRQGALELLAHGWDRVCCPELR